MRPTTLSTEHFTAREFACPCCGRAAVQPELLQALEKLRALLGGTEIRVLSGYRCESHNKAVGGAPHSQHCQGIAADITSLAGWRALYTAALRVDEFAGGGIGVYPAEGFAHVDVRDGPARWARLAGKYVGIDEALKGQHELA